MSRIDGIAQVRIHLGHLAAARPMTGKNQLPLAEALPPRALEERQSVCSFL